MIHATSTWLTVCGGLAVHAYWVLCLQIDKLCDRLWQAQDDECPLSVVYPGNPALAKVMHTLQLTSIYYFSLIKHYK